MKAAGRRPGPRQDLHASIQVPEAGPGGGWICRKCTGVFGAHFLTCPALQLPPRRVRTLEASR